MKFSPRLLLGLAAAVLAIAGVVIWKVNSGPALPPPAPATGVTLAPPGKPDADGLALERDHAAVFQRAFWRRPTADERILHAERRDWLDAGSGVEKWQWFVAVQPGAAFREWLLKENPFELVAVPAGTAPTEISSPPAWFPSATDLSALTRYRNREGRFHVFHDPVNNRLYATDAGGGFAAARK